MCLIVFGLITQFALKGVCIAAGKQAKNPVAWRKGPGTFKAMHVTVPG